jgi:phospholipase C
LTIRSAAGLCPVISGSSQTSILRFIEDNWLAGARIGGGSFDALAGPPDPMLDFHHSDNGKLILDPTTGNRMEE